METDIVVVGSGSAAVVAALTAAVGGASVTVLERSPLFGGTSAVSGGGMWLPGNDWTRTGRTTSLEPRPICSASPSVWRPRRFWTGSSQKPDRCRPISRNTPR